MKRKVYLICQKKWWKGNRIPQTLSDGKGKLLYVFASEGKKRAEKIVDRLNKDYTKQEVHLREGYLIIGRASQTSVSKKPTFAKRKRNITAIAYIRIKQN